MRRWIFLCLIVVLTAFTADTESARAARHLAQLKGGVLLIRLHEHSGVQKRLLELKQYQRLADKKEEVKRKNEEMIQSFGAHYRFSKYYFFYARNTDLIVAKNYTKVVFDSTQTMIDTALLSNTPIYILDGETVFFENFGSDFEGYALYNDSMELLEKPFPYYVRKRGIGMIRKRTENEMVMKLQESLEKEYSKQVGNALD